MQKIKDSYNKYLVALSDAGLPAWGTHMLEGALIVLVLQWIF